MDAAEKAQISSEMTTASLLTTGQMFLRLGLATVIVVGNGLVVSGGTSLFTYILFLIAASRLYDPLSGAMSNMAELFSVQLQVNRLKEIEEYPEETGEKNIHTNGYESERVAAEGGFGIRSFYGYTPNITSVLREYIISDPSPAAAGYRVRDCIPTVFFSRGREENTQEGDQAGRR